MNDRHILRYVQSRSFMRLVFSPNVTQGNVTTSCTTCFEELRTGGIGTVYDSSRHDGVKALEVSAARVFVWVVETIVDAFLYKGYGAGSTDVSD